MPELPGLSIKFPQIIPGAENFRPPSWPPREDFPVVIDVSGQVVSRYGEPVWDVSPWKGKRATLNFGDGKVRKGVRRVSPENANILRQITAWWLWGPNAVRTASTLCTRFGLLRGLFVLCSENGIAASDLMRFPRVAEQCPGCLNIGEPLKTHFREFTRVQPR